NRDNDKEPPSENGLKNMFDKAAKGMQKKDGQRKPSEDEAADKFAKTIQDLKSDDPKRREQAKEFLDQLARNQKKDGDKGPKHPKEPKEPGNKPVPEKVKKEMEKLAEDLKSNDPKRREQAEEALKELSRFARGKTSTGATNPQTEVPGEPPVKIDA